MQLRLFRLKYQQTLKVIQGFVILPTEVKDSSDGSIDEAVVRVKLLRSLHLRHSFVKASRRHQIPSICQVNLSDTRIKFYGSLEIFLSARPVIFILILDLCQRVLSFGQCLIQLQSFRYGSSRFRDTFLCRYFILTHKVQVGFCRADISQSKLWVLFNRSLVKFQTLIVPLVPKILTLQIELVGFCVGRVMLD